MNAARNTVQQTYLAKKDSKSKAGSSKVNEDNLTSIGKATGNDVCCCVQLLAEYIKEAIKLVFCWSPSSEYGVKFQDMFCDLGDTTIRIFQDIYYLIKYLVKSLLCMSGGGKKKKK
ncbi:hypothetical protein O0L34_g6301 [Tuta absoluta]|nr:hypothetical protein O0L34_g6301 [Tuta absoluta]